ncbi:MAG: integral rane protein [Chitinophagaceae bacterium]|nr:integral rane protein [Chitinophagaceae bacterium]
MNLKVIIRYLLSLVLATFLLWIGFKDLNFGEIWSTLKEVNFTYIFISLVVLVISHIIRAARSMMLLQPLGYKPGLGNSFVALMAGYFINLVVPRLGEVTRCTVLQKMEKVPVAASFGTVITERILDLIMLVLLFLLALVIEYDRLYNFYTSFVNQKFENLAQLKFYFLLAGLVLVVMAISSYILFRIFKEKIVEHAVFKKISSLVKNIWEGMLSVRNVSNPFLFILFTVLIWAMYFLAAYIVLLSIPDVSSLGLAAGLSILVMGSLGMATPVQGGLGAYHILVSEVLILYGIEKSKGLIFATIVHESQLLFTLLLGAGCFIYSLISKKKEPHKIHQT